MPVMDSYDQNFIDFWKKKIKKSYIRMLILYSLYIEGKCTGYMITRQLKAQLGHIFQLSAGAIYPQLQQFEERGLVTSEIATLATSEIRPRQPRRVYSLTQKGYNTTRKLEKEWMELISVANSLLEAIWHLDQEVNTA
ncbi:MAG: PadR family transcriptional regulator [Promethearchaeota archaeon]